MAEGLSGNQLLLIVPAVLGVLGLVLFLSGIVRLFKGRLVSGPMQGAIGAALAAAGAAVGLLGLNIQTYNRLSFEQPVATVTLNQTGAQAFTASVRLADGTGSEYPLLGDEWQMDARVLKWKPWANVMGFDASYRLERLSGRYRDINQERTAARSVHALAANPGGVDAVSLVQQYAKNAVFADAYYGSATYVPMADGASYQVTMTQTGLIARPVNATAEEALKVWPSP